jgi:multimeric flavodoxin WrbA
LLILIGSPRRDGNSAVLAEAVRRGAEAAGTRTQLCLLDDCITRLLHDTRNPREGVAEDGYEELFLERFLPADGVVFCTPVYWYGMSAQTKAFLDRSFEYYVASHPRHDDVLAGMQHKRIGLCVASEESYPGVALGIVHQLQEFARYTHSSFVGVVHGVGNRRGEVVDDPRNPVAAAEALGREFFALAYSDYRADTPRSTTVWAAA